jgi:hypothetical protein
MTGFSDLQRFVEAQAAQVPQRERQKAVCSPRWQKRQTKQAINARRSDVEVHPNRLRFRKILDRRRAVFGLAKGFGLTTSAEGVEGAGQLTYLKAPTLPLRIEFGIPV